MKSEMPGQNSTFKIWTKAYRFALLAATFGLAILVGWIRPDRNPLNEVEGVATFGVILMGLMSIFCDRSPWPGIVLFWIGLSSLLFPPV